VVKKNEFHGVCPRSPLPEALKKKVKTIVNRQHLTRSDDTARVTFSEVPEVDATRPPDATPRCPERVCTGRNSRIRWRTMNASPTTDGKSFWRVIFAFPRRVHCRTGDETHFARSYLAHCVERARVHTTTATTATTFTRPDGDAITSPSLRDADRLPSRTTTTHEP